MKTKDSKERFSDRVCDYKKNRPGYPRQICTFIVNSLPVDKTWAIADIGSGTGISSKLLCEALKCRVYGVEPNSKMRSEAQTSLKDQDNFTSIEGSAENTTLRTDSVNLITAFQSFHWFNNEAAAAEFHRILKTPGFVLFVWNCRLTRGNAFLEGYEALLQELPDYKASNHRNITSAQLYSFTGCTSLKSITYRNFQRFNLEGLKGRFFSSSYTAAAGSVKHEIQSQKLSTLFEMCNVGGEVTFEYQTEVFLGTMQ